MTPFRIILADNHTLCRQGIRRIIEEESIFKVVGEVGDGLELLDILNDVKTDMIILNICMPNLRGLEAAKTIKAILPDIKILILTMRRNTAYFKKAVSNGVEGYLLKEDADLELLTAIETIRQGETYISPILQKDLIGHLIQFYQKGVLPTEDPLTAREREVLRSIAEGKSSREIGDTLHISIRTVQNHRANITKKLQVKGTANLVRYAITKGYIEA